ncbi:MAG: filamentous hemagglutinin N-terminal domain-containing protein [Rivularia sp. (in: cyanobacteria)]
MNKSRSRLGWMMLTLGMLLSSQKQPAFAQVQPDSTLPSNSKVNQQGNVYNITGGTQSGNNLFHSFEKFGVPNGGEAYFNNAIEIQNIINRVTGKSISEINGLIRANGTANFFLINPNGILFGENAKLDIGGSFIGSTADSFQFNDGKVFSAINPEDKPLLSVNVPLGLQYGKNQTGNIHNSASLTVKSGNNITFIGNSFENTGKLKADGGQISIAAIGEGFASLGKFGELSSLEFQPEIIGSNSGNIATVINKGNIDASTQTGIGGKIIVLGKRIDLLENSLFKASGSDGGGEITVGNYDTIATYINPKSSIQSNASITGNGGIIKVYATESTRIYGSFRAKGGLNNGYGGLVETSGSNFLDITGIAVDTNANNGLNGNWLINSGNIFFGTADRFHSRSKSNNSVISQPVKAETILDISTIEKQLSGGNNITIAARKTGSEAGNIKAEEIDIKTQNNTPVTLTLQADNDIQLLKGDIQSTDNRLGMVLQADSNGNGKGSISLGNGEKKSFEIETRGGKFTASATGNILLSGSEIISNNMEVKNSEPIAIATAGSVIVENSGIQTKVFALGNNGDININAESLSLQGGIQNSTQVDSNGNAGNINIKVESLSIVNGAIDSVTEGNGNSGLIAIEADKFLLEKGIIRNIEKNIGSAGDIIIDANSVSLQNGSLFTRTEGNSNGGNISVNARHKILIGFRGGLNSNSNGQGNAGNINVNGGTLVLENQSTITSNTEKVNSQANAGRIEIKANSLLQKKGVISSTTKGIGNSGSIIIDVNNLLLEEGVIESITKGIGNAEDIVINTNSASIINGGSLSTRAEGSGNGGNIIINANEKTLINGSSSLNSNSKQQGNAGNITVNSGSLVLEDESTIASNANELSSQGNAGDIKINADSILLLNSTIAAGANGGNAGEVILKADNITFKNSSNIVTNTIDNSIGNAGKIEVIAKSILFENEPEFKSRDNNSKIINSLGSVTNGKGDAGEITIEAEEIILRNRGGIGIDTKNEGNAGKLTINTSLLQLENSRVQDNAGINSSSSGSGKAGELTINADRILLDQSDIEAQTESGDGGNIILNLKELLLLRNGSRISTTAGTAGGGGNGGNIEINAPDGFVIAIPNENSGITANAFEGEGGNIKITASGIFGIQIRESLTQKISDISASSELGIDGRVEINTPDINSTNELSDLPSIPINTKLAQGCYSAGYAQNQFFIVGRGGLPPLPEDYLTPSAVRVDWINPQQNSNNNLPKTDIEVKTTTEKPRRIVEATGWITNDKGEIIFTANAPVATADSSMQQAQNCEF